MNVSGSFWMVSEDTVPTNVYMSSYLMHRTVQYKSQIIHTIHLHSSSCGEQNS